MCDKRLEVPVLLYPRDTAGNQTVSALHRDLRRIGNRPGKDLSLFGASNALVKIGHGTASELHGQNGGKESHLCRSMLILEQGGCQVLPDYSQQCIVSMSFVSAREQTAVHDFFCCRSG